METPSCVSMESGPCFLHMVPALEEPSSASGLEDNCCSEHPVYLAFPSAPSSSPLQMGSADCYKNICVTLPLGFVAVSDSHGLQDKAPTSEHTEALLTRSPATVFSSLPFPVAHVCSVGSGTAGRVLSGRICQTVLSQCFPVLDCFPLNLDEVKHLLDSDCRCLFITLPQGTVAGQCPLEMGVPGLHRERRL